MQDHPFKPNFPGVEQALGKLQAAIMEQLWLRGPISVAELHEVLCQTSPLAYTTVFTELSRLLKKKLVRKQGTHLATRYAATSTREAFIESMIANVLAGLVDAHGTATIHGFVDIVSRDPVSLEALRKALKQRHR